jgi:hypothetical protein
MTTAEQNAAITARVAMKAAEMLAFGYQGGTVEVPELDETWTISREPS